MKMPKDYSKSNIYDPDDISYFNMVESGSVLPDEERERILQKLSTNDIKDPGFIKSERSSKMAHNTGGKLPAIKP